MRILSTKKEEEIRRNATYAYVSIDFAREHFDKYLEKNGYGDTPFDELPVELKELKYELYKACKYATKVYEEN